MLISELECDTGNDWQGAVEISKVRSRRNIYKGGKRQNNTESPSFLSPAWRSGSLLSSRSRQTPSRAAHAILTSPAKAPSQPEPESRTRREAFLRWKKNTKEKKKKNQRETKILGKDIPYSSPLGFTLQVAGGGLRLCTAKIEIA